MLLQLALSCSLLGLAPGADCREVTDDDRRSFEEPGPIRLDVDGDAVPDTIRPRVYRARAGRRRAAREGRKVSVVEWIAFDLTTSGGRSLKSFFRYDYGADGVGYWVYAFIPCDFNGDGRVDLKFYSGDDTSDETIILRNTGRAFKVHSRKVSQVE